MIREIDCCVQCDRRVKKFFGWYCGHAGARLPGGRQPQISDQDRFDRVPAWCPLPRLSEVHR